MKRKSIIRGGGGGENDNGEGGTTKKHSSSSSSNNNKRKKNKTKSSPSPPVIGTVATRTRRQTKAIASSWNQPLSILINIMRYADPETIRMLCCVSKQFYDLIYKDSRMKNNRAIPLLQISPAKDQTDGGRIRRLLCFLNHHRDKLQLYREIKIIDANKFTVFPLSFEFNVLKQIADTLRLYGIVSLDMSFPSPSTDLGEIGLCNLLSSILPNLRDINLFNNGFGSSYLSNFSTKCPNLEKLTWHNNIDHNQSAIDIDGSDLMRATNLKEIYMDGSVFVNRDDEHDLLSDLENDAHSNIFLFYQCRTKLERVSIRNAKWYVYNDDGILDDRTVIPQNALIKFVRNAPTSLRWFRSDLTEANMTILRSERPDIELVN